MGIKGIDHWVIVAGDLERTLDFYQRLGFPDGNLVEFTVYEERT